MAFDTREPEMEQTIQPSRAEPEALGGRNDALPTKLQEVTQEIFWNFVNTPTEKLYLSGETKRLKSDLDKLVGRVTGEVGFADAVQLSKDHILPAYLRHYKNLTQEL